MARKERTVSEKLGFWLDQDGLPRRAYRARIALRCCSCSQSIAPGETFARRTVGSKGMRQMQVVPVCTRCLPLRPVDTREAERDQKRREEGP